MKKLLFLLAFFSLVQFVGAPKEGIKGQIFWISGNQMPGPGKSTTAELGVARDVLIYKATTGNDVEQKDQFYQNIKTELVGRVRSSAVDGTFKIKVPPGEYSVFTQEPNGLLFGNTPDGKGCISCVVVKPKKFSWVALTVDYEAAY